MQESPCHARFERGGRLLRRPDADSVVHTLRHGGFRLLLSDLDGSLDGRLSCSTVLPVKLRNCPWLRASPALAASRQEHQRSGTRAKASPRAALAPAEASPRAALAPAEAFPRARRWLQPRHFLERRWLQPRHFLERRWLQPRHCFERRWLQTRHRRRAALAPDQASPPALVAREPRRSQRERQGS